MLDQYGPMEDWVAIELFFIEDNINNNDNSDVSVRYARGIS